MQAHPLGNFTINHYSGLEITRDGISLDYVLDMAEIPTFQAIQGIDTDRDHQTSAAEKQTYATSTCSGFRNSLNLWLNQRPLRLDLTTATVTFPPGVADLATLRLNCTYLARTEWQGSDLEIEYHNRIYDKRLGWREITVQSQEIPLRGTMTSTSLSHRLQQYPDDLLSQPLDQRLIHFTVYPSQVTPTEPEAFTPILSANSLNGRVSNSFSRLITLDHLDPFTLSAAILIAFVWGGFHALTPGHGKTLVGAYLVGSRGTPWHALLLGLTTTLTHTAGIFLLGLFTWLASEIVVTEALYPWLSLMSGGLVVAIGISLSLQRLGGIRAAHHHHHQHPHHHHEHHHHEHPHDHPSLSDLVALGISGGLLPCPSALVVLLSAIALGRIGLGMALVTAFSLGLAAVLTGVGLLVIYARQRLDQMSWRLPTIRFLPLASALVITIVGGVMTMQAVFQLQ
ncbi:MAG: high-affinity nickel-transporter [Synechococcaceae cyanobacterium SM2_3_1]|nr:high-affinity nickel-transporter [Synechococcaceae cyanobacterium SM2_3_1]